MASRAAASSRTPLPLARPAPSASMLPHVCAAARGAAATATSSSNSSGAAAALRPNRGIVLLDWLRGGLEQAAL